MFVGKYNSRANLEIGFCIGNTAFGVYAPKNTFKRHVDSLLIGAEWKMHNILVK